MTAALFTLLLLAGLAWASHGVALWSMHRWPPPAEVDPLDPEGNQAAVTRAVSVACRKVAP